jgi:GT2 family glycosyltransferase
VNALIELPCPDVPRVSVIVTASARLDLLQACLRSVARCGPSTIPYETIVVLNRSLPHTEAQLRGVITGAHVISSPVNLGIAGSNNRGRHLARGELLLLLHDDTEVEPGWMEALVETADAHPHAGAIGGKVLFPDGQLQYAGSILWRDATTSPPWIGEAPAPDTFDRLRAVDYCGTSSLMVRASAWDRIGGADERLHPVYYVDVDLCMAIRQLGLAVLYQPASRTRHRRGATTTDSFKAFLAKRNRLLFLEKWGAALEQHEPHVSRSPAAIERALGRAEAVGERARSAAAGRGMAVVPRAAFDPAEQERRLREHSHGLREAYVSHLEAALKGGEESIKQAAEMQRILGSRSALARRLARMLVFGKAKP